MEPHEPDAVVAATLTTGSLSAASSQVASEVVRKYLPVLEELLETGGASPKEKTPPIRVSPKAIDAAADKTAR